jgi:choline dehydrogenase-like flavoprotein
MNNPVVVIGSGASGVHFALSALRKGHRVVMLDVGHARPTPVSPGESLNGIKRNLEDPVRYFLGPKFEALILPDFGAEYYGFPPSKTHVFREHPEFRVNAQGFSPLVSFAAGGLAEAWTGGSYPFNDDDLKDFPLDYAELGPFYGEVARRIGLSGAKDDLARFYPVHDGLMEPLQLDEHSALLLRTYERHRRHINENLHSFLGRARLATLTRDHAGRKACDYSGRCLWGCPSDSLYTPAVTLRECRTWPTFEYRDSLYVDHFRFDSAAKIRSVIALDAAGLQHEIPVGRLVLAAGTLCSAGIFLESIRRDSGRIVELRGLMDNRQVLMPFVNLGMLGKRFKPESYQYHQVAIGVRPPVALDYVHGLVTTLKTALIHPVVQNLPFDLGTSAALFRNLHAALGLVNINFSDHRREENRIAIEAAGPRRRVLVHYRPAAGEPERLARTKSHFRKLLWKLGCVAPPPMTHVRPMGASVHYAGVLPMSRGGEAFTCTPQCRSNDFENLWFVDGASFPFLPSKNLTFTLMANAARVAEQAF